MASCREDLCGREHRTPEARTGGANAEMGSQRGGEAGGHHPPAPEPGAVLPPNTWWAPAGLSWESRGAHRLWGGRLWDRGDPRPRGVLAGSQPTGPGHPRGDPSQTPPFQLHGSAASH